MGGYITGKKAKGTELDLFFFSVVLADTCRSGGLQIVWRLKALEKRIQHLYLHWKGES